MEILVRWLHACKCFLELLTGLGLGLGCCVCCVIFPLQAGGLPPPAFNMLPLSLCISNEAISQSSKSLQGLHRFACTIVFLPVNHIHYCNLMLTQYH